MSLLLKPWACSAPSRTDNASIRQFALHNTSSDSPLKNLPLKLDCRNLPLCLPRASYRKRCPQKAALRPTEEPQHSNAMPRITTERTRFELQFKHEFKKLYTRRHIRIYGNKQADKLANLATLRHAIDIEDSFEYQYITTLTREQSRQKWAEKWKESPKFAHYYKITPSHQPYSYKDKCWYEARQIFWLSSEYNNLLNTGLLQVNRHEDGLSDLCKKPKTITHFLLKCNLQLITELENLCERIKNYQKS